MLRHIMGYKGEGCKFNPSMTPQVIGHTPLPASYNLTEVPFYYHNISYINSFSHEIRSYLTIVNRCKREARCETFRLHY